jgi:hypothetical protein
VKGSNPHLFRAWRLMRRERFDQISPKNLEGLFLSRSNQGPQVLGKREKRKENVIMD